MLLLVKLSLHVINPHIPNMVLAYTHNPSMKITDLKRLKFSQTPDTWRMISSAAYAAIIKLIETFHIIIFILHQHNVFTGNVKDLNFRLPTFHESFHSQKRALKSCHFGYHSKFATGWHAKCPWVRYKNDNEMC